MIIPVDFELATAALEEECSDAIYLIHLFVFDDLSVPCGHLLCALTH